MTGILRVDVEGRKYTVIQEDDGRCRALRYGEEWLDLTSVPGSNMTMALAWELRAAREQLVRVHEVVPPLPLSPDEARERVDYTEDFKLRRFHDVQQLLYGDKEPTEQMDQQLYVLSTHGDGEGTSLHRGWDAICQAVVTCHYYNPDSEQRAEVMQRFTNLEDWQTIAGVPWRWTADYEDGQVVVERVTGA